MPGIILVSVLEFEGLQSSSLIPPEMSIKVSLGKREYRTWDKEDFSFPLTSLRDQLMITVHDVEGNEISHTGVETRLVVEKGIWDDLFLLEGIGYVHLKLQFVLSDEERRRIREMRESALKKKLGELSSDDIGSPGNATIIGSAAESPLWLSQEVSDSQKSLLQSEVVATPAGFVLTPSDVIKDIRVGAEEREEIFPVRKETNPIEKGRIHQRVVSQGFDANLTEVSNRGTQTPPDDVPVQASGLEKASAMAENSELVVAVKNKFIAQKLEESGINNPKKQSPVGKTPSSVRNMISAFETNLSQDTRPHMKPPPAKSQSSKVAIEAALKSLSSDEVKTQKIKPTQSMPTRIRNPFLTEELQQATYTQRGEQTGPVRAFKEAMTSESTREFGLSEDVKAEGATADSKNKLMLKQVKIKEEKNSSEDLMRGYTCNAATVSGKMLDEHIGRQQPGKLLVNKLYPGGRSSIKESAKVMHPEYSEEVDNKGTSTNKQRSKENLKNKHYSFRCPGTWIFPVESRHPCITTCGKEMMDLMRDCHAEVPIGEKSSATENIEKSSVHGGDIRAKEIDKPNLKPRKPRLANSADGETSRGTVGQVMRVAIMVGFATLVVFTRQRNS